MADYYVLATTLGQAKLADALATSTPISLTEMAVGDGAGAIYNPNQAQTALLNEVDRFSLNALYQDSGNANWVVAEAVIPANVGGYYIREAGIFDSVGDMIFVIKYPETYKPVLADGSTRDLSIKAIMEMTNSSQVSLTIDPNLVVATQEWVTEQIDALIDGAPVALDTLNELAAAFADDENFASTMTAALAGKSNVGHTHVWSDITDTVIEVAPSVPTALIQATGLDINTHKSYQIEADLVANDDNLPQNVEFLVNSLTTFAQNRQRKVTYPSSGAPSVASASSPVLGQFDTAPGGIIRATVKADVRLVSGRLVVHLTWVGLNDIYEIEEYSEFVLTNSNNIANIVALGFRSTGSVEDIFSASSRLRVYRGD